jgi:hypothetical protein
MSNEDLGFDDNTFKPETDMKLKIQLKLPNETETAF